MPDETPSAEKLFETAVNDRKNQLRIYREAERQLDDETRPPKPLPPVKSLSELLTEPDLETPYLINGLAPADHGVVFASRAGAHRYARQDGTGTS
jgi:hypothetical protein